MYLYALFTIALIFTILFLILFFRAFTIPQLMQLWKQSKINILNRRKYLEKKKKLESQGLRKFTFENGKIEVFAKTQAGALYQKKELVRNQKRKNHAVLSKR